MEGGAGKAEEEWPGLPGSSPPSLLPAVKGRGERPAASAPHLSSSLLGHVVAVSGLQLLLLASGLVLPGKVPHAPLVLEFPALMAAQLHVPEEDLLVSQLCLQVLQLFPLPLRQVFPTGLLTELRDLGQEGRVKSSSYQH